MKWRQHSTTRQECKMWGEPEWVHACAEHGAVAAQDRYQNVKLQAKINDVPGRVEEWHISSKVAFWIQETLPRLSDVERSAILWFMFAIGSALTYFSVNVPLLHTSRYVTARLSFTRPPPMLVLQATNTGVRRPGYEATFVLLERKMIEYCLYRSNR